MAGREGCSNLGRPREFDGWPGRRWSYRQPQVQPQERTGFRGRVPDKEGWAPLVGHREVQQAVAVHVGRGDAAGAHRLGQPDFVCQVVIAAVSERHVEGVVVRASDVVAGLPVVPEPWVPGKLVVHQCRLCISGQAVAVPFVAPAA